MTLPRALLGRRAALLAASLILSAFIGLIALVFARWREAQLEERKDLEAGILTYRGQVSEDAAIGREAADLANRMAAASALVRAPDNPRGAAELQDSVRRIAATCGGDVRSAQVLPFRRTGAFDVISIQAEITVPAARLPALLYAVETHQPYIFVASADIVAPMKFDKGSIFDVQWVLRAYRWHSP